MREIIDVATGEIRPADVGIVGEMIASVHPRGSREDAHEVRSLAGGCLSPGLSGHPRAPQLAPAGRCAVFSPRHHRGVLDPALDSQRPRRRWRALCGEDASRHLPLRVMVAAPSAFPSHAGSREMAGADFAGAEMETMLGLAGSAAAWRRVMDMRRAAR